MAESQERVTDSRFEKSVMIIDSLESLNDESDKTQILHLRFSWSMEQHSRVGAEWPV